jgi:hypothetical protein
MNEGGGDVCGRVWPAVAHLPHRGCHSGGHSDAAGSPDTPHGPAAVQREGRHEVAVAAASTYINTLHTCILHAMQQQT